MLSYKRVHVPEERYLMEVYYYIRYIYFKVY
jgi:hypothetical protein